MTIKEMETVQNFIRLCGLKAFPSPIVVTRSFYHLLWQYMDDRSDRLGLDVWDGYGGEVRVRNIIVRMEGAFPTPTPAPVPKNPWDDLTGKDLSLWLDTCSDEERTAWSLRKKGRS